MTKVLPLNAGGIPEHGQNAASCLPRWTQRHDQHVSPTTGGLLGFFIRRKSTINAHSAKTGHDGLRGHGHARSTDRGCQCRERNTPQMKGDSSTGAIQRHDHARPCSGMSIGARHGTNRHETTPFCDARRCIKAFVAD